MEEIIHAFGIDWRLIVIQMFNFAILAAALWYFLYTPVLMMLKEREEKIKQGVEDANAAKEALAHADAEKRTILTNAQGEASEIVARASTRAEEKGSAIVRDAEDRAARTIAEAAVKAEEIKTRAQKESEAQIAQLALLATEKILRARK